MKYEKLNESVLKDMLNEDYFSNPRADAAKREAEELGSRIGQMIEQCMAKYRGCEYDIQQTIIFMLRDYLGPDFHSYVNSGRLGRF